MKDDTISKCSYRNKDGETVTPNKKADIFNSIKNQLLEGKKYDYVACVYNDHEDDSDMFFVILEGNSEQNHE